MNSISTFVRILWLLFDYVMWVSRIDFGGQSLRTILN